MSTETLIGKTRRLQRIFPSGRGRSVIVPLDGSLISGSLPNSRSVARKIISGEPDAILGFAGLLRGISDELGQIATIVNVSASTTRATHVRKTLVGGVENAIRLGADAVAAHLNIANRFETAMLGDVAHVAKACEQYGFPFFVIAYPRREGRDEDFFQLRAEEPEQYARLVAHAARVAVDLGADIVKTQYTGTPETFRYVVEACAPIPVVVAGGPLKCAAEIVQVAESAVAAGAAGVSFGRNVFEREDADAMLRVLRAVVHKNIRARDALATMSAPGNPEDAVSQPPS